MQFDLLLKDARSGTDAEPLDIGVRDGKIAALDHTIPTGAAGTEYDCRGLTLLPGLIDAHNHPYYDENMEQFSRSALRGGITSLMSFAGSSTTSINPAAETSQREAPVGTTSVVRDFIDYAVPSSVLDFGTHAILSAADIADHRTIPALRALGVASFKVFMAFPGSRMLDDGQILSAMEQIAAVGGICMVHCENGHAIAHLEQKAKADGHRSMRDYIESRPPALEAEAINRAITLATISRCPLYIVHVSTRAGIRLIRQAKADLTFPIFAETCPHYLLLTLDDQASLGPLAKVSPPFRRVADLNELWAAVADGTVDVIASDASGQCRGSKSASPTDAFRVPFGIPGITEMVALVLDESRRRGVPLTRAISCMSDGPARIFGLAQEKGRISVGLDADFVLFDRNAVLRIHAVSWEGSGTDYSLFEGREVVGRPVASFKRGGLLWEGGDAINVGNNSRYLGRS